MECQTDVAVALKLMQSTAKTARQEITLTNSITASETSSEKAMMKAEQNKEMLYKKRVEDIELFQVVYFQVEPTFKTEHPESKSLIEINDPSRLNKEETIEGTGRKC